MSSSTLRNVSRCLTSLRLRQRQVFHGSSATTPCMMTNQFQTSWWSWKSSLSSLQEQYYSTKVEPKFPVPISRMQIPSNLKLDPRVMKNLLIVDRPKKKQTDTKGEKAFEKEQTLSGEEANRKKKEREEDNDDFHEDDEDESYEDDDDILWFQTPESQFVIPLPDRLTVPILNKSNLLESVGTIALSSSVFGQNDIRVDIIKRVVVYQRNKKRGKRFPAKTKTIAEVRGSGKKVRNQKGGGVARAGHSRPPHWRGGAKAHGPKGKIQDYTTKLNKHTRKLGLVHALSQKLKEGNLMLVNDFLLDSHKTKELASVLGEVGLSGNHGKSAYLVDWIESSDDSTVHRNMPIRLSVAVGNLANVKVSSQAFINVYSVLKYEKLILSLAAVQALEERLQNVAY
jgi:large subunit ribosomal protein L4